MKILLVASTYSDTVQSDENKFLHEIAKHLAGESHEVKVIVPTDKEKDFEGIKLYPQPSLFENSPETEALFIDADVIIGYGSSENLAYNKGLIQYKKPLVLVPFSDKKKSVAVYNLEVGFIYPKKGLKESLGYLQNGIVVDLYNKDGEVQPKALKSLETWLTKFVNDANRG